MPDKTITQLTTSGSLTGSEEVPLYQSGGTFKALLSVIKTFILNAYAGAVTIVTLGTVTTGVWNSSILKRVSTATTTATLTPNIDLYDIFVLTAQGAPFTIANPTGTPNLGQEFWIRIKDDGTNRAITFGAAYRFSTSVPAPGNTNAGKTLYMKFMYDPQATKYDCQYKDEF